MPYKLTFYLIYSFPFLIVLALLIHYLLIYVIHLFFSNLLVTLFIYFGPIPSFFGLFPALKSLNYQ